MGSRNLFLKSNSLHRARRLLFFAGSVMGIAIFVLYPRERKLEDWTWQSPVEPPGVTIVSHETQALVRPMAPQSASVVASEEPSKSSAVQSTSAAASPASMTAAAMLANDQAQIRKALELWSTAWSSRNMEAYFAQYAKSFVPGGGQSRSAWEKVRRQRILSKNDISHEMRDLQIVVQGDHATANFEQMYATDQTRLVGPKTLQLKREGVNWLIISEISN